MGTAEHSNGNTRNPGDAAPVAGLRTIRADFHTHTNLSHDGHQTPRELVERARTVKLDRVAVTDHHTLDGALRAQALDGERVIVGEEITARCGTHIIGLFLTTRIAPRRPLEAIVEEVRAQGGVVYLPHPFAYLIGARRRAERALPLVDLVEVWNSRAFYSPWNARALEAVRERELPEAAGTDAHFAAELGRAVTLLPNFSDAASLKIAARHARTQHTGRTYMLPHVGSVGCAVLSRIRRRAIRSNQ